MVVTGKCKLQADDPGLAAICSLALKMVVMSQEMAIADMYNQTNKCFNDDSGILACIQYTNVKVLTKTTTF